MSGDRFPAAIRSDIQKVSKVIKRAVIRVDCSPWSVV
jgi:hypothetical protein